MSLFEDRLEFRPFQFPQAEQFSDLQTKNFWDPKKIVIKGDIQEYLTTFNPGQKHGTTTGLKLFTKYEVFVGNFWGQVEAMYGPVEIKSMAALFAAMELKVHATFYDRLNDGMGLATKHFYLSFLEDPNLKARIDTIGKYLKPKTHEELLMALAVFTIIEGVVLYSSFAFFMSFQANGMNKLSNIVTGLRYSTKDEYLHAEATSWLFNETIKELDHNRSDYELQIVDVVNTLIEQEDLIVDEMFSVPGIKHISATELKTFVRHRANKKLEDMGFKPIFEIGENPVAVWFYDMINAQEFGDFFHNESTSYEMTADFSSTVRKDWKNT